MFFVFPTREFIILVEKASMKLASTREFIILVSNETFCVDNRLSFSHSKPFFSCK